MQINANNTRVTSAQSSAFFLALAAAMATESPYKSAGARALAQFEPLIRSAYNRGVKDEALVKMLNAMPDSPTLALSLDTAKTYLGEMRREFGMYHNEVQPYRKQERQISRAVQVVTRPISRPWTGSLVARQAQITKVSNG